jgi:Flp pilus assembly protein TadB
MAIRLGDILVVLVVVVGCLVVIRSFRKAAAARRRLDLLRELSPARKLIAAFLRYVIALIPSFWPGQIADF